MELELAMNTLQTTLHRSFRFMPDWVLGVGLVCFAILCALAIHGVGAALMKRAIGPRRSLAVPILEATSGPTRLALCLVAVAFVMPAAPLSDELRTDLTHLFAVATIALIGWISIRAVDLTSTRYLLRYADISENLMARKHVTQVRVFKRVIDTLIIIIAVSTSLMTFDSVRQYGVSLFASAGAAGIVVGLAARPLFSNLIAGLQIAITQPIRIEDAVIIENEWGWVEDIASTYVVIRLWDWRRMVVPLSYFIERPFQNWTRDAASLIGSVIFHVDYAADVGRIRKYLEQAVQESKRWDGAVVNLQVVDADARAMQLRALVSARNAPESWDLRCEIREKLISFLQREMPKALPRERADISPPLVVQEEFGQPPARMAEARREH
jgi:small-conductance mechanosensitive channel